MKETKKKEGIKMYYINFKLNGKVETQDEYRTLKEAKEMIKEYKMVSSNYYLSTRCTKDWRESKTNK